MEYLSSSEQKELEDLRREKPFAEEALCQVDRILASKKFERVQQRSRDFLRFVVAWKLLGKADEIKEVTIAIRVWKASASFDPNEESGKVRQAGVDLRQRLVEYNTGEGHNDPIEITLPNGGYVPDLGHRHPTVAVSLFDNWNPDREQDFLPGMVREELVHQLARTGCVRVQRVQDLEPRDHPCHYGVLGSVECRGDALRLNVSLSDWRTRAVVMSESFEAGRDDIMKLSRQAAAAIVAVVKPELGHHRASNGRHRPEPFEALHLYQQGRFHFKQRTPEGIRKAIELFERSTEANREYARAYSGLADCYLVLSWYELSTPDRRWFEIAKANATRAFELNSELPEIRTSLGYSKLLCDFDWIGAEEEFNEAIRLDIRYPQVHHWYGNLLVMQGRFEEAEAELKRAFHLDPGSSVIRKTLGEPHYYSGCYPQAIAAYQRALEINPGFWKGQLSLGWAYEQIGETAKALEQFEAVKAHAGMSSIVEGAIGHLYAASGREEDAHAIIRDLQEKPTSHYVAPHTLAVIYAGLGDKNRAFQWLEASYENRIELVGWIKVDPRFAILHDDPRFGHFLARIGLLPPRSDGN